MERYAALDPLFATEAGVAGYDEFLPDFSPDGTATQLAAVTEMCDHLATLSASDDVDRISLSVMRERLETSRELFESGESERLFQRYPLAPLERSSSVRTHGRGHCARPRGSRYAS